MANDIGQGSYITFGTVLGSASTHYKVNNINWGGITRAARGDHAADGLHRTARLRPGARAQVAHGLARAQRGGLGDMTSRGGQASRVRCQRAHRGQLIARPA